MKRASGAINGHNYLSPEQVEYFWTCLFGWQERLGLNDWRITRSPDEPKGRVQCEMAKWDFEQRQVTCRLKHNWFNSNVNETTIEQTAVHELLHVMLANLIETAKVVGTSDADLLYEEHGVINRLEQLLVPGERGS